MWCSWVVQGKSGSFYFAGDTGYSPLFKEIGKRFGPFDLACLPIGAYLPQWFMGPVHLSPGEAIRAYFDLQARKCLAVHWGTFSLADDPPDLAPQVLLEEIKNHNLSDKDVWLFDIGEIRIVTPKEPLNSTQ